MFELIPAYIRQRNSYVGNAPSYRRILEFLDSSNMKFPTIKFQITTRGNETHVVKRGIKSIVEVAKSHQIVGRSIELLVVTENPTEIKEFTDYITEMDVLLNRKVINVPNTYTTTKGTLLKARSLQFSLEYRKQNGVMKTNNNPQFIFYFDAESTISVEDFRRVIYSIISNPNKKIFEGPIVYPHRYFESGLISRQMEASRPFGCYHCAQVMKNPPPLHLHGSNLLVEEHLANEIGWDFGTVKNRPLLAEDLMFGLKAYSQFHPWYIFWVFPFILFSKKLKYSWIILSGTLIWSYNIFILYDTTQVWIELDIIRVLVWIPFYITLIIENNGILKTYFRKLELNLNALYSTVIS